METTKTASVLIEFEFEDLGQELADRLNRRADEFLDEMVQICEDFVKERNLETT